ncbi:hypothetical protein OE88DRAFT_1627160, partial [Heliocybe sulcata]
MYIPSYDSTKDVKFPPKPASKKLLQEIIHNFVSAQKPTLLEESGCAVCGVLCPVSVMDDIHNYQHQMHLLTISGKLVTRKERFKSSDPIESIPGPVLAHNKGHLCPECAISLQKGQAPFQALANGLWLGNVPKELQDLTLAEKFMVAKVRHNRCVVRVASGGSKMRANAVMFANPTPKIYNT